MSSPNHPPTSDIHYLTIEHELTIAADLSVPQGQMSLGGDNDSGDFGLIGLAVMGKLQSIMRRQQRKSDKPIFTGQNIILNGADHGFTVVAFNRTVAKVDRFLENEAKGKSIVGAHSAQEFVAKLKKPRRMMLLVQAGKAVDDFIELLLNSGVEQGDIISQSYQSMDKVI